MENHQILDKDVMVENSDIETQYIIDSSKFAVLSILTFGIYEIWWMYKVWRFFKAKEGSDIMPAARAIFSIIFLLPLLNKVLDFAKEKEYPGSYSPGLMFVGFLLMNFLSRLPDPYWLVSLLGFLFVIPGFKAFNYALLNSTDINVVEQTTFSGRQLVLIILGLIFSALVIWGIMEPGQEF